MALGGGVTPAWMLTTNKETIVNKQEKLIQILETMANAYTPTDGATPYVDIEGGTVDYHQLAVDTAYRVGRALTLARSINRSNG